LRSALSARWALGWVGFGVSLQCPPDTGVRTGEVDRFHPVAIGAPSRGQVGVPVEHWRAQFVMRLPGRQSS
jgi:hypothetical protein